MYTLLTCVLIPTCAANAGWRLVLTFLGGNVEAPVSAIVALVTSDVSSTAHRVLLAVATQVVVAVLQTVTGRDTRRTRVLAHVYVHCNKHTHIPCRL